jgi:hypothetical protein
MSQDQIHRDLRKFLKQKFKRAIQDHVETCEAVDIEGPDIASGLADTLIHLVVSYFMMLDLKPQQFGQLMHDAYKELQDEKRQAEA